MVWTPWQSLQDGATISPIFNKARPWMLSAYCTGASGYFMRYSLVSPGLLWHFAQVCGRFSLKTGESGFLTDRMSWVPWQSLHVGAPDAPIARLTPWMLVAYSLPTTSWQPAQDTDGGFASCGNSVMPV